jgi:hypothetical protein
MNDSPLYLQYGFFPDQKQASHIKKNKTLTESMR